MAVFSLWRLVKDALPTKKVKLQKHLREISKAFTEIQEETRPLVGTEDKDMKEVKTSQTSSEESSTSTDSEESEEEQLEKEMEELQHKLSQCQVHWRVVARESGLELEELGCKRVLPPVPPTCKEAEEDKDLQKEVTVSQIPSDDSSESKSSESEGSEKEQLERVIKDLQCWLCLCQDCCKPSVKSVRRKVIPSALPAYESDPKGIYSTIGEDAPGKGVLFQRQAAHPVIEMPEPNNPGQVVHQHIALTFKKLKQLKDLVTGNSFAEPYCLVEIIPCGVGNIKSNVSRLTGLAAQTVYGQIAASAIRAWKALPNKDTGKQIFGDADQAMPVIKQLAFKNTNKYYNEKQLHFKAFADLQDWLQASGLVIAPKKEQNWPN